MKFHSIVILLTISTAFIPSCNNGPAQQRESAFPMKEDAWTAQMKAKILADFNQGTDSLINIEEPDGVFYRLKKYRKGRLVLDQLKSKQGNLTVTEVIYTGDGRFEIRREYCRNGQMAFEAIVSNDEFYGLNTWWDCEGRVFRQGMKYRSKLFGRWYFDMTDSTKMRMENYGLLDHLDSLNLIKF